MNNPIPQGNYCPAVRHGSLIFTAGMTPRKDGVLLLAEAITAARPVEAYRDAAVQAAENALTAARNLLQPGERIARILSLTVYLRTEPGYTAHSKVADLASDYLVAQLGAAGAGARAAVGTASLPGDAPLEIQLIAAVESSAG